MSGPDDIDREAARVDRLYRAKAVAELTSADRHVKGSASVRSTGDELADVVLVKGVPGSADVETGRALGGADGEALGKALDALGLPAGRFAICSRAGKGSAASRAARLQTAIEAVDPRIVIALDADAAADLAAAFGSAALPVGTVTRILGRDVLAVDDFAGSLGDERRKRRVWSQLKTLRSPGAEMRSGRP